MMNRNQANVCPLLMSVLSFWACDRTVDDQPPAKAPEITNRIELSSEVINNLGITFVQATRGKLGKWKQVPGELEVPESSRWTIRTPARARLLSVVPRWRVLVKGAEIARLTSADLQEDQRALELAQMSLVQLTEEIAAHRKRLAESEIYVREARAFEQASRSRLSALLTIKEEGNALTSREVIEARRTVTDASKASLDAAIVRDQLVAQVSTKQIHAEQARLSAIHRLRALAVLTGLTEAELLRVENEQPVWQSIHSLIVRAPASGVVVDLFASQGEALEQGSPIMQVFDTSELRFRGHLPEGDLGELSAGAAVRLEFPSRRMAQIQTTLDAPLPVADAETRMIHIEAAVTNERGILAHGISVMAHIRVSEGKQEEVLIPRRCVVFDGLEAIVFRRDPNESKAVVRTPVELGGTGANLVEVMAGILDGDEVVDAGIHQLKQTGLGKPPLGGHFHVDGTWHTKHK
jgi:RND family efflux transporter MFP subunit